MESLDERAARLNQAQQESLDRRQTATGLIPPPQEPGLPEEVVPVVNPMEDACMDALIYAREGMSRQEIIDVVLMRNRIRKIDAEKIVDQVLNQANKKGTK